MMIDNNDLKESYDDLKKEYLKLLIKYKKTIKAISNALDEVYKVTTGENDDN